MQVEGSRRKFLGASKSIYHTFQSTVHKNNQFPKKHKNRTEPSSPSEKENEVSDNNTYNNTSSSNSSNSSNSTTLIRNEEAGPEEEMDPCKLPLEVESDETTGGHESKNIFS